MDDLTLLGLHYRTDKVDHSYTPFYYGHLEHRRSDIKKVLEIGIFSGASLQMWRDYFPNAEIHGMDLQIPEIADKERIVMHKGSQEDIRDLENLIGVAGSDFDLIIDDGGHTMAQQQISLGFLFPHVKSGGIYVLEDLHTSFMETIDYYADGNASESTSTGVKKGETTSFDLIEALSKFKLINAPHISNDSLHYILDNLRSVAIFDPDDSHKHITSIIHKT